MPTGPPQAQGQPVDRTVGRSGRPGRSRTPPRAEAQTRFPHKPTAGGAPWKRASPQGDLATPHLVLGPLGVVADAASDELVPDHGRAVGLDLVLVDIAAGQERIALLEPLVRSQGGVVEDHEVVEGRVELCEAAVDFLAEVLAPDSGVEPRCAGLGEVQVRDGGDEPCQAHLGGDRHLDSRDGRRRSWRPLSGGGAQTRPTCWMGAGRLTATKGVFDGGSIPVDLRCIPS